MPRIFGVDIPREKRTVIALGYLYGVGRSNAKTILAEAQIDPNKRAKDLTEKEISNITAIIQKILVLDRNDFVRIQLVSKRQSSKTSLADDHNDCIYL